MLRLSVVTRFLFNIVQILLAGRGFRNFYHDTWLGYVREKGKGHAVATNEDLVSSRFMHLTFQCMSYSFLTSSLLHITFTNETPLTTSPSQPQSGRLCVARLVSVCCLWTVIALGTWM